MKTTMKSALKAAALLLVATVMTAGMTSCSNDDDNSTKGGTSVAGTTTSFTVSLLESTAKAFDGTVEYTDGAGVKHTEAITGQTIQIKSSSANSEGDLYIHMTLKKDVELTESLYYVGAKIDGKVQALNSKGTVIGTSPTEGTGVGKSMLATKVADFLAGNPEMKLHYSVTTDEKAGTVTLSTRSTVSTNPSSM